MCWYRFAAAPSSPILGPGIIVSRSQPHNLLRMWIGEGASGLLKESQARPLIRHGFTGRCGTGMCVQGRPARVEVGVALVRNFRDCASSVTQIISRENLQAAAEFSNVTQARVKILKRGRRGWICMYASTLMNANVFHQFGVAAFSGGRRSFLPQWSRD